MTENVQAVNDDSDALEATSSSTCVGKVRTNESMIAKFEDRTNFSAGNENVPVPDTLKIKIPLYLGSDAIELVADFKFRVKDGSIFIGYRLLGVDQVFRDAIKAVREQVIASTEIPVFI